MSRLSIIILAGLVVGPAVLGSSANAASEAVVYAFKGGEQGHTPYASLIKVGSKLYGTTLSTVYSLTLGGYRVDLIKIMATGGVLDDSVAGTDQQFTDEELRAIMQTAHSLGRRVAAHAHGLRGIRAAVLAGVDSIKHGTYLDDDTTRLMHDRGTYLVPTLMAGHKVAEHARTDGYFPPAVRAKALAVGTIMGPHLRRAHAAGVKIAFGTDSAVSPHGWNAREFALMVSNGLSQIEAIEAARVNAADLLG